MTTVPSIDCPLCGYRAIPLHGNHYQCPNDCDYLCQAQPIMGEPSKTENPSVDDAKAIGALGAATPSPAKLLAALKLAREAFLDIASPEYGEISYANEVMKRRLIANESLAAIDAVIGDMGDVFTRKDKIPNSSSLAAKESLEPKSPTPHSPNDCRAALVKFHVDREQLVPIEHPDSYICALWNAAWQASRADLLDGIEEIYRELCELEQHDTPEFSRILNKLRKHRGK